MLLYGFKLTKHGTLSKKAGFVRIITQKLLELSRLRGSGPSVLPPPRDGDDESQPDAKDDEYNMEAPDMEDVGETEAEGINSGMEEFDVWGQNRLAAESQNLLQLRDNP